MGTGLLGLVLDSSSVIAAERKRQTALEFVEDLSRAYGPIRFVLPAIGVVELVHGIYRARDQATAQRRREFVEHLVHNIPVHSLSTKTAWLAGRIHGSEAAQGNLIPVNDLIIGATAIELGYGVLTVNIRHFRMIPGLTVVAG